MGVNGQKVLSRVQSQSHCGVKALKTGPLEAEQLLLLDSFNSSVEYIRLDNMIVVHVRVLQHADNKESRNLSCPVVHSVL